MSYVDGFLLPISEDRIDDYKNIAGLACEVWKEHGALDYKECVLDDTNIGHLRPMAEAAGAREGEAVIFAFIVYESFEARNEINEKVMADPRIANMDSTNVPFDDKRMAFGGFQTIVEF